MKNLIKKILPIADIVLVPFVYLSALLLKGIRKAGVDRLCLCKNALYNIGVFPIRNHYSEPQFDMRGLSSFSEERSLPGIDWNIQEQLDILEKLNFSEELKNIPSEKNDDLRFYFNNGAFESGDAEYWYQLIRLIKPKRIFEIGGGNSTLMAINAVKKNGEQHDYQCKHIVIEPYEAPWLEKTGVTVFRKKVEDIETSFFQNWSKMIFFLLIPLIL